MEDNILDADLDEREINQEEIEYGGFWIRVGASIIDSIILMPVIGIGLYNATEFKSLTIALITSTIGFLYKPLMEGAYGATLGKKAFNLQIVDTDFNNISMNRSFVRNSPWAVTYIIGLITTTVMFTSPQFQNITGFLAIGESMQDTTLNLISQIYNVIFVIIIGVLIFDDRKQGLHDKLANTFCIKK